MKCCTHCGCSIKQFDQISIGQDNTLVCPFCGEPIEIDENKDVEQNYKAMEAIDNIWSTLPDQATNESIKIHSALIDIEQELKEKDKDIKTLELDVEFKARIIDVFIKTLKAKVFEIEDLKTELDENTIERNEWVEERDADLEILENDLDDYCGDLFDAKIEIKKLKVEIEALNEAYNKIKKCEVKDCYEQYQEYCEKRFDEKK